MRTMNQGELATFLPPWLKAYPNTLNEADCKEFLQRYEAAVEESFHELSELPANEFDDGTDGTANDGAVQYLQQDFS